MALHYQTCIAGVNLEHPVGYERCGELEKPYETLVTFIMITPPFHSSNFFDALQKIGFKHKNSVGLPVTEFLSKV